MTYSSGGLIQAADYNSFASSVNEIWGTGNGPNGYGQSNTVPTVAATNTVTATQWSTLISRIDSCRRHQSNTTSGVTLPTAGATITYTSALSSAVTAVTTNAMSYYANGGASTSTTRDWSVVSTGASTTDTFSNTRTVTFASIDAARFFFNAGGALQLRITNIVAHTSTTRGYEMASLLGTNLGGIGQFRYTSNGGRTGTGGTLNTNNTATGYYDLTTSAAQLIKVTDGVGSYSGSYAYLSVNTNSGITNGGRGNIITFTLGLYSDGGASFNDAYNLTVSYVIDVIPPETTYLANSWGSVVVQV